MGFQSVLAAAADGDGQEVRRCIEGRDTDRDGLFDRSNPQPAVVVGRDRGIHGRFNQPTLATETGSMGESALHKAAADGRMDMCAYLLSAAKELEAQRAAGGPEALLRQRNHSGQTPLMLACLKGSLPTVMLLIDAGSDLEGGDDINGLPPLHCAVRNGHVAVAQALLDAGADPNCLDGMGGTALHVAARYNVADAVDVLAGGGTSLDLQRFSDRFTALHLACKYNTSPNTVQALLQARADPGLVSRAGYPPAYLAASLGVQSVVEFMTEKHWEQLLKNTDKEGMTRLREGGQLTVRASFDKTLQRLSRAMSDPDGRGLWWDPSSAREEEGENEEESVRVEGGLPSGRWVSKGPVGGEELERALDTEVTACFTMLKSKVGLFTSDDKVMELVLSELGEPLETMRTVNQLWTEGRAAVEAFEFSDAQAKFKAAGKLLKEDWWATRASTHAEALSVECLRLGGLKESADKQMSSASKLRERFQFADASVWYKQAAPIYAEVGYLAKLSEATYRHREMDTKAALKEEADTKMLRSKEIVSEYAACEREEGQEEDPVPPTRMMIAEGVELLLRCLEIYAGYGHEDMRKRAEMRLEKHKWSLERQDRAHTLLREAAAIAKKYKKDTAIEYVPTADYPYGDTFHRLRFADSLPDFEMAETLFKDIKDNDNIALSGTMVQTVSDREERLVVARGCMAEGQLAEASYTYDIKLKNILVFGAAPLKEGEPPRQPYVRHAIPDDYPLSDEKYGVAYQRLMLDKAVDAFAKSVRLFEYMQDAVNVAEARRREALAIERREFQREANELVKEGLQCIKSRQYYSGHEKFAKATELLGRAADEVNARYVGQLMADAAIKNRLGDEATRQMDLARELVAKKESFEKWQDIISIGLDTFAEAEALFDTAAQLYENLDDEKALKSARELMMEAEERKIHAQELKTCRCVVVQPAGDWAPQRRDKNRRTMPYDSVQHAIADAATQGTTSTYHTKSEIRTGSTIFVRAGTHKIEKETILVRRTITIAAEEGITADMCMLNIDAVSLMQIRAPNVRLERLTLRQIGGDGEEDYWSGGLFSLKVVSGSVDVFDCTVSCELGTGVVVTGSGKATLTKALVLDCGHYGVAADGKDALVDLRECEVEGSKFEDYDQRNGARIVGIPGQND